MVNALRETHQAINIDIILIIKYSASRRKLASTLTRGFNKLV